MSGNSDVYRELIGADGDALKASYGSTHGLFTEPAGNLVEPAGNPG